MKLVTFQDTTGARIGLLAAGGARIVDLSIAAPDLPRTMLGVIGAGASALARLKAVPSSAATIDTAQVKLLAPVPAPARNIYCVGKNYREHAAEFHNSGFDASAGKEAIPDLPIIFTKASNTVTGPGDAIPAHLDHSHSTDYEGELTVVIGKGGRGITKAQAFEHVFGYTIVNDVTARTLQNTHKQWFIGKNIDGFCPMGPCIATADEVPDVTRLHLQTRVNGELRQDALVEQLIFDVPTLIETLSRTMTLMPGDLIATGTCAGVGIGFKPPKFLKKGDSVAITIEPIGTLTNPVA